MCIYIYIYIHTQRKTPKCIDSCVFCFCLSYSLTLYTAFHFVEWQWMQGFGLNALYNLYNINEPYPETHEQTIHPRLPGG